MSQLLLVELNEISFDLLKVYAERGRLPNISRLMAKHGLSKTTSETDYSKLEPWIQWVTAHTGLTFAEHGVFRLGDIVNHDLTQIWEWLEEAGLSVGAISPMNAKHRTKNAAFFVPDPWTPTALTARPLLCRLHAAIAQATNDNAVARLSPSSVAWLCVATAAYARLKNYGNYLSLAWRVPTKPWAKAMLLDLLLCDVFIKETRRANPHFGSLFVNGAAHIQHHYMFNSVAYAGEKRNPEWYVAPSEDPVADVYELYDRIVGNINVAFPNARLMIATGLHQKPHSEVTFYWRLRDHAAFLREIRAPFVRVEPRMSRDFLVACSSREDAETTERILRSATGQDGMPLFEIDNRGSDLFVMFVYANDIPAAFSYSVGGAPFSNLREKVAFVAIKNGEHNGIGFFIDTGVKASHAPEAFPLKALPQRVCAALGTSWNIVGEQRSAVS